MNAAKAISVSAALEQEIKNAALLSINVDDLERLKLQRGVEASRLKIDPSRAYRPVIDRIVSEVISYDIVMIKRS